LTDFISQLVGVSDCKISASGCHKFFLVSNQEMGDANNIGQMDNSSIWERKEGDHPLQTPWAFWYDKKQSKKTDTAEYRSRLQKIGSFDTVESFWQFYSHLKRPSTLEQNVNLYLFRDGPNIAPMWEAFPR
jgi:hypothetical protein